jgi:hypothetical protein
MEIDEKIVVHEKAPDTRVGFDISHRACRANAVGYKFDATAVMEIIGLGLGLVLIRTLLIERAAVPGEVIDLIFDIKPNQINFADFAIFIIKELDLIPEGFLDGCNEVIMQYWRWDAVSTIHDWKPKTKSFLLNLACWCILLCTTRGGNHSVIVLKSGIATGNGGSWSRSGGAVRHRLLVPVENLQESLVEIT